MAIARTDSRATALLELGVAAGNVANFCDHAEHNEATERDWVIEAGKRLRMTAERLAAGQRRDIVDEYARRLAEVEARNPLAPIEGFDGGSAAREAETWLDLQRVQATHDRLYHPDVFGLSKEAQLRHYALHLAKLVGALARSCESEVAWRDFQRRRLPDMLLFGLKLATVMGERLPEVGLREKGAGRGRGAMPRTGGARGRRRKAAG